ncbi:MAG: zf-HC2 domain-containing protein [Candidatus Acidiferrales bacterium]
MASRDRDDAMAGLLRRNLAGDAGAGNDCPGPDILAAYFEHSLDADETARFELHFSQCAHCREQLAGLARANEVAATARETSKQTTGASWLWDWRWLAPAAAVLVFAAIWFARRPVSTRTPEPPLVAMSQPPQQLTQQAKQEASPQLAAPAPSAIPATRQATPPANSAARMNPASAESAPSAKLEAPSGNSGSIESLPLAGRNYTELQAPSKTAAAPQRDSTNQVEKETVPSTTESVTVESAAPVIVPSPGPASLASQTPETKGAPVAVAGGAAGGASAQALPLPESANARKKQKEGTRSLVQQSQVQAMYQSRALAVVADNERSAVIQTPDAKILWRIATGGFVERSEDGGTTWQGQLPNPNAHLVAGSAPGPKVCWFVGDGGIILLTQDAKRWQTIRPPLRADFTAVTAQDVSSATVTAADGRKFATTNRGKTWTPAP